MLDLTSNFIFSGNTNFSPSTFIVLGRNIVDFKTNILKYKTYPLNSLLFQVEGVHLKMCIVCGIIRLVFSVPMD